MPLISAEHPTPSDSSYSHLDELSIQILNEGAYADLNVYDLQTIPLEDGKPLLRDGESFVQYLHEQLSFDESIVGNAFRDVVGSLPEVNDDRFITQVDVSSLFTQDERQALQELGISAATQEQEQNIFNEILSESFPDIQEFIGQIFAGAQDVDSVDALPKYLDDPREILQLPNLADRMYEYLPTVEVNDGVSRLALEFGPNDEEKGTIAEMIPHVSHQYLIVSSKVQNAILTEKMLQNKNLLRVYVGKRILEIISEKVSAIRSEVYEVKARKNVQLYEETESQNRPVRHHIFELMKEQAKNGEFAFASIFRDMHDANSLKNDLPPRTRNLTNPESLTGRTGSESGVNYSTMRFDHSRNLLCITSTALQSGWIFDNGKKILKVNEVEREVYIRETDASSDDVSSQFEFGFLDPSGEIDWHATDVMNIAYRIKNDLESLKVISFEARGKNGATSSEEAEKLSSRILATRSLQAALEELNLNTLAVFPSKEFHVYPKPQLIDFAILQPKNRRDGNFRSN